MRIQAPKRRLGFPNLLHATMNETEEILKASRDDNSEKAEASAWWIIGGLIAEAVLVTLFSAKSWTLLMTVVAPNAAIAIGVWREIHFGQKAREDGDKLDRLTDTRIAEANRLASEANERAAQANTLAVALVTAFEEDKAKRADRAIPEERHAELLAVLSALTPIPGTNAAQAFCVIRMSASYECVNLANQIGEILVEAHWAVSRMPEPWTGPWTVRGGNIVSTAGARSTEVAEALKKALTEANPRIDAGVDPTMPMAPVLPPNVAELSGVSGLLTRLQVDGRVVILVGEHP